MGPWFGVGNAILTVFPHVCMVRHLLLTIEILHDQIYTVLPGFLCIKSWSISIISGSTWSNKYQLRAAHAALKLQKPAASKTAAQ